MLQALVIVLLLAWVYFVGLLFWRIARATQIVVSNTRRARAQLASEIAILNEEQIRERLLDSPYFAHDLRRQPAIEDFLTRVARRQEVALRRQYSTRRLYSMLTSCERAAGRRGRPDASDYIDELDALLDALSVRSASV